MRASTGGTLEAEGLFERTCFENVFTRPELDGLSSLMRSHELKPLTRNRVPCTGVRRDGAAVFLGHGNHARVRSIAVVRRLYAD